MTSQTHAVLLPVKPPALGKSRLVGLPAELRRALAAAFALDAAAACVATPSVGAVLAVTDDAGFSAQLESAGCSSIPDGVAGDLNASLRLAAAEARRRWPSLVPVALCADLPALRPDDLAGVLALAPADRACFVADADGIGTTLYVAPHAGFDPRFGVGSRLAHLESGAREITGDFPGLRRDVDDLDDLRAALGLGVGPHTAALEPDLARH